MLTAESAGIVTNRSCLCKEIIYQYMSAHGRWSKALELEGVEARFGYGDDAKGPAEREANSKKGKGVVIYEFL